MSDVSQQQHEQVLSALAALTLEMEGLKEKRREDRGKQIQQWALVVIGGLGVMFTVQETFKASIKEVSTLQTEFMNRRLNSVEQKIDALTEDLRQTHENTQAIKFLRERQDEWIKRMSNP